MIRLAGSLRNWRDHSFARTLKAEVEGLATGSLPLDKGTTQGGQVDDSNIAVTVIDVIETEAYIRAKMGVFFSEIVGGCSCGDDPVTEQAYCEMLVSIDKETAEAEFSVLSEGR